MISFNQSCVSVIGNVSYAQAIQIDEFLKKIQFGFGNVECIFLILFFVFHLFWGEIGLSPKQSLSSYKKALFPSRTPMAHESPPPFGTWCLNFFHSDGYTVTSLIDLVN